MFSVPTSRLCSDLRIFVNLACASDRSVIRAPLSHASPVSRLPEGFLEKNDLARCVFISFFPARLWWPQINVLSFAFSSFHVPENGSARRLCLLFLNTNTRIGARR